jgi:hypothetical protein
MSAAVRCPGCGKTVRLTRRHAGKLVACTCGQRFRAPAAGAGGTAEVAGKTCPSCGKKAGARDVLCVGCGYNFKSRRMHATSQIGTPPAGTPAIPSGPAGEPVHAYLSGFTRQSVRDERPENSWPHMVAVRVSALAVLAGALFVPAHVYGHKMGFRIAVEQLFSGVEEDVSDEAYERVSRIVSRARRRLRELEGEPGENDGRRHVTLRKMCFYLPRIALPAALVATVAIVVRLVRTREDAIFPVIAVVAALAAGIGSWVVSNRRYVVSHADKLPGGHAMRVEYSCSLDNVSLRIEMQDVEMTLSGPIGEADVKLDLKSDGEPDAEDAESPGADDSPKE